jgi:hypothetical protein
MQGEEEEEEEEEELNTDVCYHIAENSILNFTI